jgi:hypothetical protein
VLLVGVVAAAVVLVLSVKHLHTAAAGTARPPVLVPATGPRSVVVVDGVALANGGGDGVSGRLPYE